MQWTVYILECGDGSYYVGMTRELDARLRAHQAGKCRHTSRRLPVALRYLERLDDNTAAARREQQIKKWSRHKKSALIAGETNRLKHLARCRGIYPLSKV